MTHARLLPVLLLTASAATVVDHKFADGDSQNQDLENNSLRLFNGRTTTIRTDKAGSVTLDVTPTGTSSEAFWAYSRKQVLPSSWNPGDSSRCPSRFR